MAILQADDGCDTHGDTCWYLYGLNAYYCQSCDNDFWKERLNTPEGVR